MLSLEAEVSLLVKTLETSSTESEAGLLSKNFKHIQERQTKLLGGQVLKAIYRGLFLYQGHQ